MWRLRHRTMLWRSRFSQISVHTIICMILTNFASIVAEKGTHRKGVFSLLDTRNGGVTDKEVEEDMVEEAELVVELVVEDVLVPGL